MGERTDKLLANLGYCSRRAAREFLRQHRVTCGNHRIMEPDLKIEAKFMTIDGIPPDHPEGILILMNKPAGYICTHDEKEGKRVYDLLPLQWMRRNPIPSSIGRLDKDTTGVLLITDIPGVHHHLGSAGKGIKKIYQVAVDKPLETWLITHFTSGTLLLTGEKKPCLPVDLTITGTTTAEVSLTEGKYHQVKKLFGLFGYEVVRLHRSQFADFTLDGLAEGCFREIALPA